MVGNVKDEYAPGVVTQAQRRAASEHLFLAAAQDLFGEVGYDAVSMDAVCARAGLSKGNMYHYFPTKDALFERVVEAVAEHVVGRVVSAVDGGAEPSVALKAGIRAYLRACQDPSIRQVLLVDGPRVLGRSRWRDLDHRYFLSLVHLTLGTTPLDAQLLVAAIDEAALVVGDDTGSAGVTKVAKRLDLIVDAFVAPG